MKQLFALFALLLRSISIYGQNQKGFNYQGMILNDDIGFFGVVDIEVNIDGQTEIHQNIQTSEAGTFNIVIGSQGIDLELIDWSIPNQIVDIKITSDGQVIGTTLSEFQSVPYALNAETVSKIDWDKIENIPSELDVDPENEIQNITRDVNNNTVSLSLDKGGNTVSFSRADGDANNENELQDLKLNNDNTITISDGDSNVDLNPIIDEIISEIGQVRDDIENGDGDRDAENEIQNIARSVNNNTVSLSLDNGGNTVSFSRADGDANNENELQDLKLNDDNTISISDGSSNVDLNPILDDLKDQIKGEDGDQSDTNELQDLSRSISNNTVTINIDSGQGVSFSRADGDANSENELQDLEWVTETYFDIEGNPFDSTFIQITNGNRLYLGDVGGVDLDADPRNEIQELFVGEREVDTGELLLPFPTLELTDSSHVFLYEINNQTIVKDDQSNELVLNGGIEQSRVSLAQDWSEIEGIPGGFEDGVDNVNDGDTDDQNELQDWSNLPGVPSDFRDGVDNVNDGDSDDQNELQDWSNLPGIPSGFTDGVDNVNDGDTNDQNELQDLILNQTPSPPFQAWTVGVNPPFAEPVLLEIDKTGSLVTFTGWFDHFLQFYVPPAQGVSLSGQSLSIFPNGNSVTLPWGKTGSNVHTSDNVGIGTTTPSEKLHVVGNVFASLDLIADDDVFVGDDLIVDDEIDINASKIVLGSLSTNSAFTRLRGTNNNTNVLLSSLSGFSNNGFVSVHDSSGDSEAGIYVNSSGQGVVFGDVKNFVMEHPSKSNKSIVYASLEGPEAAAYERGTDELKSGECIVLFSEHFSEVVNSKYMTVIITPLSADSKGIAVIEKLDNGFKVKELYNGTGSYQFDWEVKSIRKGYESFKAVRDSNEFNPTELKDKK